MMKTWTRTLSAAVLGVGLSHAWVADGQGTQRSQQQRTSQSGGSNNPSSAQNQSREYQDPGRYERYGAPGDYQYREPGYFQQGQNQDRSQGRYNSRNQGRNQGQNRTGYQLIDGRIDSFRKAYLSNNRGYRADHTLAKLQLQNGETTIVDLGPSQTLRRLNFEPGDRIQVRGRYAQVGRRQVVVAQEIKIDDTVTRIRQAQGRLSSEEGSQGSAQRYSQSRSSQVRPSQQRSGENVTLSGQLDGFRHVNLRNTQDESSRHSLVRVRLENGRSAIVDLGPKKDLDALNLESGKQISIQGRRGSISGRPVLHANRIRVDGETHQIQRSSTSGGKDGRDDFTVRGSVRGYDLLSMHSGTNTVALLNLHLQDGRHILIDAGSEYTVGDFNLRKLKQADEIIIKGQQKTIKGKPVLVVESIGALTPGEDSNQDEIYSGADVSDGDQQRQQNQKARSNRERQPSGRSESGQSPSGTSF